MMNQTQEKTPRQARKLGYITTVFAVLIGALLLRTYQVDWDAGTHVHPDERYLTMVSGAIQFPFEALDEAGVPLCSGFLDCWQLYLDTSSSPLNPGNHPNYASYSYGTFPLFFTRYFGLVVEGACIESPEIVAPRLADLFRDGRMSDACSPGLWIGYNGIHIIGRLISAIMDVSTVLAVLLIAKLLRDEKTSILAGLFYALAVLPIQHSHFFVVDNFATAFTAWTLYFSIHAVQRRKLFSLTLAGIMTGMGVACKISVWPLALVVALSGFIIAIQDRLLKSNPDQDMENKRQDALIGLVGALIISGVLAAFVFRIAQPYAFTGPGLFGVGINPDWRATMEESLHLASGERDVPFGHQWTARTPVIFPLANMVFWGVGLPLGIAAWLGWFWVGWGIYKKRIWSDVVLWIWGTGYFLYQGTQWVKSMRYILPIYPVFVIYAAIFLIDLVELKWLRFSSRRTLQRVLRDGSRVFGIIVLLGTGYWVYAFSNIYRQPLTRLSASEWMFENIPTAVTVITVHDEQIHVPIRQATLGAGQTVLPVPFQDDIDDPIKAIRFNKVLPANSTGVRDFRLFINDQVITASVDMPMGVTQAIEFNLDPPVAVSPDTVSNATLELFTGAPVVIDTTVIANEHWDDPLPLRVDGKDPYWNWYRSLTTSDERGQMNNYDNDNLEKRASLLAWLDEADVIALSSNRLYASIPRLSMRYPLTTEYYRVLFSGELGFELAAEFVSFPTAGNVQFPDQEIPFSLVEPVYSDAAQIDVPYPPAEEAYSVYDHPSVLIFRKTDAYSRENAERLLPASLLDNVIWMTPLEATRGSGASTKVANLTMSPEMAEAQQTGGTWSDMFNPYSLRNSSDVLAALIWWLLLALLGWMAWPIVYKTFPNFMLRGYGLARILGLLIWAWLGWILASLHVLPSVGWSQWLLLGLLLIVACYWYWRNRSEFWAYIHEHWRDLLRVDLIFTLLFVVWTYIRAQNPDLWHPVSGGEKPMDFAFFNAIIKSTWFPPYDPWFSSGVMNYYYFGFVLFSTMTEALGIVPSIAYNLAVPSLYAFTGIGAYTLAANFVKGDRKFKHRTGLWGLAMVLLLGNYGELQLLFTGFKEIGGINFDSLIPGYPDVVSAVVGMYKFFFRGVSLNFRPEWWYWNATRIAPFQPGEVGTINEFPGFSFLYADLHAHSMALPLTQLALALALHWVGETLPNLVAVKAKSVISRIRVAVHYILPMQWQALLIGALVLGSLRATNTWDYPTYLALMSLGLWFPLIFPADKQVSTGKMRPWLWRIASPVVLLILAELAFKPYSDNFVSAYLSVESWEGSRTPLGAYLVMHAQFLLPLLIACLLQGYTLIKQSLAARDPDTAKQDNLAILVFGVFALSMILFMAVLIWHYKAPVTWIAVPIGAIAALIVLGTDTVAEERFRWFMVGTAMALSIFVEIFVLKGDIGRMNTVFKFYLQVWMLLGISAAVTVSRVFNGELLPNINPSVGDDPLPVKHTKLGWLKAAIHTMLAISIGISALYPLLAIPAKNKDRWIPNINHTLDGAAYIEDAVQYEHGSRIDLDADYRVIRWMQQSIQGSPVIMEQQAEREYLWGGRISVYTGLPAVASWRWHSVQQRLLMPGGTVEARQNDVRLFYMTTSASLAQEILDRYNVSYVVLTPYDIAYTLPEGLAKFDAMVQRGMLNPVYADGESVVYEVVRD